MISSMISAQTHAPGKGTSGGFQNKHQNATRRVGSQGSSRSALARLQSRRTNGLRASGTQVGRQVGLVVKAEDQKGAPQVPKLGYEMGSQGGVTQDQKILTKPPQRKQVKTIVLNSTIGSDLVVIKGVDDETERFEAEYSKRKGSTENSYLYKADKTCLIDIPDAPFAEAFGNELKMGLKGRPLEYITLGNYCPRMAKTLAAVLNGQPAGAAPVEIYCSNPAVQIITAQLKKGSPAFNRDLLDAWKGDGLRAHLVPVKSGVKLDIGQGHNLSFFLSPTPRWPDGMFVYDPSKQKLFCSKFFGAHIVSDTGFDDQGFGVYKPDYEHYFNTLIGTVATQAKLVMDKASICPVDVSATPSGQARKKGFSLPKFFKLRTGLRKLVTSFSADSDTITIKEGAVPSTGIAVATICPKHGPVIRNGVQNLMDLYDGALAERMNTKEDLNVAVIYASAYGNTGMMADAVATGLEKAGCNVKLLDCEFMSNQDITELVSNCQGFAMGSPTLGGHIPTPVSEAIGAILKNADPKSPYGVFGSYGWSGEAVPAMASSLQDGGFMASAFSPISLKFKPTDEMIEMCEASGEDLGRAVRKFTTTKKVVERKNLASNQKLMSVDDKVRAVGHITTSVTAVTACINEVDSMMLCSWVSQASFNPPAITLAVPKDDSPEGFLLLNSKFIVNVIGVGKEKNLLKLLNKGYVSGDNCFEGFEIDRDEESGTAVLKEAASYIKCTVTNRMDTGDHYVLYATLDDGKVLDSNAATYFHHRVSGGEY